MDGSIIAQLSTPDMCLPIQYALFYPTRLPNELIPRLDIRTSHSLTFDPLDRERYPCFSLAVSAGKQGGTYPAVLRAADEVAVQAFLDGKIGYTGIHRLVEQVLSEHESLPGNNVAEVLSADEWASARSKELAAG